MPLQPILTDSPTERAYCEQCRYVHRTCHCQSWQLFCDVCSPASLLRNLRNELLTDATSTPTERAITALLDTYGFSPAIRHEAEERVMQVLIEAACNSNIERERLNPAAVLAALRGGA